MTLRLAVVACPRSGTRYLATLLRAAGVSANHEASTVGPAGVELATCAVDVSWLLVPHLPELRRRRIEVALLTRHPLLVISSCYRRGFLDPRGRRPGRTASTNAYALHHSPELATSRADAGIERAARFWLAWNRRALAPDVLRVRVEDLDAGALVVLGRLAGVELARHQVERALRKTSRTTNSDGEPARLSWAELGAGAGDGIAREVLDLCTELGHPADAPARPPG